MLKSLQGRLSLLFIAFVLLVLVSVGAMMWGLEAQRQDALVINLAGRQRMLAQQMARLAFEAGEGQEAINTSLQEVEQIFDQTLFALLDGGPAPYLHDTTVILPATRDPEIRSALKELDIVWGDIHAQLDELQKTSRNSSSIGVTLQAVEQKSSTLAAHADEVVRLYESNSTAKVNRLRAMQTAFLAVALILLGIGAWITRQSVLKPLGELSRAAVRLGKNDLDSEVQVAGPNEIRRLSEAFDSMRQGLRASRSELLELMSTLEERVAQRTHELDALNEVSREIASQLDARVVLNSVTEKTRTLLNGDSAMLCLLGEKKQRLHLQATSGLPGIDIQREYMSKASQASAVLTSQRALVCNNAQCLSGCAWLTEAHAASHAIAPLRIGDEVTGALCVSSSQPDHFGGEAVELLTKLANTAAVALQNAQLYAQAERVATLEERQRVAAEMHDGLGQTLSYLGLMTDQVVELLSSGQEEAAFEELHRTRKAIEAATSEVRRAINNLMDESPGPFDLCARLQNIVNTFEQETRLSAALQVESSPRCSRQAAEQVISITREALKNVARHAGAKNVTVRVGQTEDHYFVSVEDDGKGFDGTQPQLNGHFGLKIIQARALSIGGLVKIESAQGRGTRVLLTWAVGMGK